MIAHFKAADLEALRRRAVATWVSECRSPDLDARPDGWQRSPADPMMLLSVFTELQLRPGYELQAYITYWGRSMNSVGVVWAVPAGTPHVAPEDCEWVRAGRHESAPKPPGALEDVMEVIDGSRSPWSYVCASLLAREIREFGSIWHGVFWGAQAIIDQDPWRDPALAQRLVIDPERGLKTPADEVIWPAGRPTDWRVVYRHDGEHPEIRFFTFSGFEIERIRGHRDTFDATLYRFTTIVDEVARGHFGYIV